MSNNATTPMAPPTSDYSTDFSGHAREQASTTPARRGGRQFVIPQSTATAPVVEPTGDTTHDCPALDGECDSHMDDNGVTIHHGPEFTFPVDHETALPPFQLTQYGDEEPHIVLGLNAIEFDADTTAALIRQVDQYALRLAETRKHLLAAVQQHRLDTGTPLAVVRSEWERVRLDHAPHRPAGLFAYSPAGLMRPVSAVEYNRDTTTPEALRTYLDRMIGPDRVEYTSEVADALAGFEMIRRADPDPKALALWDEVEQQVIASDDPVTCVAEIAKQFATEELDEFISQHDGRLVTRPPETGFLAWTARVNGRFTVVVPEGFDPVFTLKLVREMAARTGDAK